MGMESIGNPTLTTDINGIHGIAQYMLRQDIGGGGIGLDLGILTDEFDDGFRFGLSIINLFGTIDWSQTSFLRDQLEPSLSKGDSYYRSNEFLYLNLVIDSIAASSFMQDLEDPFIYYEFYKVFPSSTIIDLEIDAEDALVVELSDGTYLIPSVGEYILWEKYKSTEVNTSYTISDNYSKYSQKSTNTLKTRQPMHLRISLSKRWENQAVVAMDLVTGFINRFSSSSSWKFSIGAEITRYKNKFLRMGYSAGGLENSSISFGYGSKMGKIVFDVGISMHGGISLSSLQGIDLAAGLIWQIENKIL